MFTCMYVSGMLMLGTPDNLVSLQSAASIQRDGNVITIKHMTRDDVDVAVQNPEGWTVEQFLFHCEDTAIKKVGIE